MLKFISHFFSRKKGENKLKSSQLARRTSNEDLEENSELEKSRNSLPLFRKAALDAQHVSWLGDIVLVRPISFTFLSLAAIIVALIIVLFLIFGTYTKRSTVMGQLIPKDGQVKVYVRQTGTISEKYVEEGQLIHKGDKLFAVSSERYDAEGQAIQKAISDEVRAQRDSLKAQLQSLSLLHKNERDTLITRINSQKNELKALASQTDSQNELVEIAEDALGRYAALLDKGYISMQQLQQRQVDLLGQRQTQQGLIREQSSLEQKIKESEKELDGLADRQKNQQAEIERQLSNAEQQLSESESKRTLAVTAPESGIATAVLAEIGQSVDAQRPLLSIVPENSKLEAELYAPSRSIGFIKTGDKVLLRYQPYPYQKFGQGKGEVSSISRTSISFNELAAMVGSVPGLGQDGEQLYRLRVNIDAQSILAYGKQYPLQSGMLIEADVMQEKRHLYEWILEPLYSITGKL